MKRLLWIAAVLATAFPAVSTLAFKTSYWAWQRNELPSESDLAELSRQGVRTLYWQLGQLESTPNFWRWKARFSLPSIPKIEVIPVLRLESHERAPFTLEATRSLVMLIAAATHGRGHLQIDCDCPDRLLLEYAEVLKQIRKFVPQLSITALPGWIRQPALAELGSSVTEMMPMLYDFEADPVVPGASPVPVIVPEKTKAWLAEWNRCRTPWRVGLPNFMRLTVYDPDGKSRGHIREWNWDSICGNEALILDRETRLGVTVFRAGADTRIGNTLVREKQIAAARWPERAMLAELMTAAQKTSARGVVIFRLPDSAAASGWSLRQLHHLDSTPRLTLKKTGDSGELNLTNEGDGDLEPLLGSETALVPRGYALQIEAETPLFREAEEGDFRRVRGEVEHDGHTGTVMIPLATRLTFFFNQLRAGQSLRTGLIGLAPGADFGQIRFRIVNSSQAEWQPCKE